MVKLDYHADAEHPEVADLVLTVKESTFRAWRFGAGLSFDFQRMEVRGRVVHTRHYFLGGLRTLQLRLEPAYVTVPNFWQPVRQGPAATAEAELTQLDLFLPRDELQAPPPATISGSSTRFSITGRARSSATRAPSCAIGCGRRSSYNFE